MADDRHYVPGSFYRICDRTGFKVRAGKTRMEWDGLLVRDQSWEARQPQDMVQGEPDDQTVSDPRPRQVNVFIGPLGTVTNADAAAGDVIIVLQSAVRMLAGDTITIMMDNGVEFLTTIALVLSAEEIEISAPLPWSVASGNDVLDYTAYASPNIG